MQCNSQLRSFRPWLPLCRVRIQTTELRITLASFLASLAIPVLIDLLMASADGKLPTVRTARTAIPSAEAFCARSDILPCRMGALDDASQGSVVLQGLDAAQRVLSAGRVNSVRARTGANSSCTVSCPNEVPRRHAAVNDAAARGYQADEGRQRLICRTRQCGR